MKRLSAIITFMLLLSLAPGHAATLGTVRLGAGDRALALRIEHGALRARLQGDTRDLWSWHLEIRGASFEGKVASPAAVRTEVCETILHAALDPSGARPRVVLAATSGVAPRRSLLSALELSADGSARVLWSHDGTTLPGLGLLAAAPTPLALHTGGPRLVAIGSGWPTDPDADPRRTAGSLRLLDAETGRIVSDTSMAASVTSGITALDFDSDGAADRLYFADANFRLWRIAARPDALDRASLALRADLADLASVDAAPAFAPDVALLAGGTHPALRITFGASDRPGRNAANHWLVQLTDSIADPPIVSNQLQRVEEGAAAWPTSSRGLLLALPAGLVSPVLTASGTLIAPTASPRPACRIVEAVNVDLVTVAMSNAGPSQIVNVTTVSVQTDPGATLLVEWLPTSEGGSAAQCRFGDVALTACPAAAGFTRDYWKRSDAP